MNHFRTFVICLILCSPFQLDAQLSFGKEFDTLMDRANDLYEEKDYKAAGLLYDEALALKNGNYPLTGYYKDGIKAWARAGNMDKAYLYLFKLLEKGWITQDELTQSETLKLLKGDARWQEALQRINRKNQRYGAETATLIDIWHKDQTLRRLMACAEEKFQSDSVSMGYFWQMMNVQDSLNLVTVEAIIDKYGWLGANKIGDQANRTLWLVIQHCNQVKVQQKYLPLIKASVLKGETPASKYAFLVDRIAVNLGEPQVYGTQICTDRETGQKQVCPITDPENVDERRKEVGFEPLQEYLEFFGADFKS